MNDQTRTDWENNTKQPYVCLSLHRFRCYFHCSHLRRLTKKKTCFKPLLYNFCVNNDNGCYSFAVQRGKRSFFIKISVCYELAIRDNFGGVLLLLKYVLISTKFRGGVLWA